MNKYNKLNLLGKGSYGTVYKVNKKNNNKVYALKQINIRKLKNTYEINNLINELKILCFHNCDYLLKCREIFYDNNHINIVTDYAKYSDLSNYILKYKNKNKYISETTIWNIFIQSCYGIEYLHEYNIIHRDLKPANILLNEGGSILLADFGISKIFENNIKTFTLIGTPYYISPEMYKDINYDKKIDIWSLGCILYELVTLNVPFNSDNMIGLKKKIITGYYYDKIPIKYSRDIQKMIHFLLNTNVEKRPNIKQILNCLIFKKKEHELKHINFNKFDSHINDKLHNQYSPPKITSKWNILIDDIDKSNNNKSPKFIDNDSEVIFIDNNNNKSNYKLPEIKKDNLPKINFEEKNKYPIKNKKNYHDKPLSPIKNNKYFKKYNSNISNNNHNINSNYPKLPRLYNYNNHKNNFYNDMLYKYPNYYNYQINKEYNANYYKNKYKANYNIINNSKYY